MYRRGESLDLGLCPVETVIFQTTEELSKIIHMQSRPSVSTNFRYFVHVEHRGQHGPSQPYITVANKNEIKKFVSGTSGVVSP